MTMNDDDYLTAAEWINLHHRTLPRPCSIDDVIERLPVFNRDTFTLPSLQKQVGKALRAHGFKRRHARTADGHRYIWER